MKLTLEQAKDRYGDLAVGAALKLLPDEWLAKNRKAVVNMVERALGNYFMDQAEWLQSMFSVYEFGILHYTSAVVKSNTLEGATWGDIAASVHLFPEGLREPYSTVLKAHGVNPDAHKIMSDFSPLDIGGRFYHILRERRLFTMHAWAGLYTTKLVDPRPNETYNSQYMALTRFVDSKGYVIIGRTNNMFNIEQRTEATAYAMRNYGSMHGLIDELRVKGEVPMNTHTPHVAEAVRDVVRSTFPMAQLAWRDGVGVILWAHA